MSNDIRYKEGSYRGAAAITPSDSANLTDPISAIYVGGTGAIKVDMANGDTVTFAAVAVGIFPIAVKKVYATGTAATNLIGLK